MNVFFFPRLAAVGIRKNGKLYLPYILSLIGMVMMSFIIQSISYSSLLRRTPGGNNVQAILSIGKFVIAFFALIFLFYTNSFLVRRRYREFGLYNVLGMGKKDVCRVVFWENLLVSLIGLIGGIGFGVLFSKLCELGLLRAIHAGVDYNLTFEWEAVTMTLMLYGAIFLLILIKSLIQVSRLRPLELLCSESAGEKPVRANWVLALIGLGLLGGAYYISVTIESPMSAITLFFVAVLMVIAGTYLLFISGSVALCKLLQKNKKYYYKKQHFVSVSSMTYRMKRNGAGFASICILATMVLVMISSTSSLYFGADDMISTRFPQETYIDVEMDDLSDLGSGKPEEYRAGYEKILKENGVTPENVTEFKYCLITGLLRENTVTVSPDVTTDFSLNYDNLRDVYFVSVSDYNRIMGTDLTLGGGEAYLLPYDCKYSGNTVEVGGVRFNIKGQLSEFVPILDSNAASVSVVIPTFLMVISDYEELRPLMEYMYDEQTRFLEIEYYYGYDCIDSCGEEKAIDIWSAQTEIVRSMADGDRFTYDSGCVAAEKSDFYSTFGGLFFLGIVLSGIFIFAAAMIIYYKQVSEGYEDKARFAIMQKVGMTDKDIKKSINSQVLTVFFAPLLFAGVHLVFAFPMVWKLLQLFYLRNLGYAIGVTAAAFVLFGVFYAVIYKLTARAYYSIVK